MKLTNTELREIKKLVDMGLGLKVSFPRRTEPQVLTVYNQATRGGNRGAVYSSRDLSEISRLTACKRPQLETGQQTLTTWE